MSIQVGGERPLRGGFDPGATIVDGRPLRDGFDLPIAVDVGFPGLNRPCKRSESHGEYAFEASFPSESFEANADASPDSNPYPPLPTAAKKNFPQPLGWER